MRRLTHTALSVCFGLLTVSPLVMGQTPQAKLYIGRGAPADGWNGQAINSFGTGDFLSTPKLTGLFATVGGGLMLTPHWGAGAEINWRAGQGDYAGLSY